MKFSIRIFVFRVGAKNSGTRFLSFVDTMLGYCHLLTVEDLNKAASMCSSLKGHLRSRFIVLSDDRDPPPPPVRGKRGHPDADSEQNVGGKRFQVRAQVNQPSVISQPNALPVNQGARGTAPPTASVSQSEVTILTTVPVPDLNVSTPFEPVKNRRSRRLPAGVKAIPPTTRVTPDRQAKAARARPIVPPQPDPDAIDLDINVEDNSPGSDMEADSGGSTTPTANWVSFC